MKVALDSAYAFTRFQDGINYAEREIISLADYYSGARIVTRMTCT